MPPAAVDRPADAAHRSTRHSGNCALVSPVPCQVSVQPPYCLANVVGAVARDQHALAARAAAAASPSFLSSTSDSRTAWRATARCSGAPSSSNRPASGRVRGLRLLRTVPRAASRAGCAARRRRAAPSGSRPTAPARACWRADRLPAVRRHEHVEPGVERGGAARVAAARHLAVRVPVADHEAVEAACGSLSTSVSSAWWPCSLMPCQLENDAMTVCTPAQMRRGSRRRGCRAARPRARGCRPGRVPSTVPPSPRKCLAVAITCAASRNSALPACPCRPVDHRGGVARDTISGSSE